MVEATLIGDTVEPWLCTSVIQNLIYPNLEIVINTCTTTEAEMAFEMGGGGGNNQKNYFFFIHRTFLQILLLNS